MTHLSRLSAPRSWPIERKGTKFVVGPSPGPHSLDSSMPLGLVVKDLLRYAKNTREVKKILNAGKVLVDGVVRKSHRFPVGFMDIISVPTTKEHFRMLYNNKWKFTIQKIPGEEARSKICKVIGKKILKGQKIQLNLYDGKNILVDKDVYHVGDSVVISDNKIEEHLKLEKGAAVFLSSGKHVGEIAVVEGINKFQGITHDKVVFKINNKKFETNKEYAFVIKSLLIK